MTETDHATVSDVVLRDHGLAELGMNHAARATTRATTSGDDRGRELAAVLTELAGRVATTRAQRGTSLRALGALTGLSSATLSEFERGEHDLTVRKAAPLVRWLLAAPAETEAADDGAAARYALATLIDEIGAEVGVAPGQPTLVLTQVRDWMENARRTNVENERLRAAAPPAQGPAETLPRRRRIGGLDGPTPDGTEDQWPDTFAGLAEAAHGLIANVDGSAQGWEQDDDWVEAADRWCARYDRVIAAPAETEAVVHDPTTEDEDGRCTEYPDLIDRHGARWVWAIGSEYRARHVLGGWKCRDGAYIRRVFGPVTEVPATAPAPEGEAGDVGLCGEPLEWDGVDTILARCELPAETTDGRCAGHAYSAATPPTPETEAGDPPEAGPATLYDAVLSALNVLADDLPGEPPVILAWDPATLAGRVTDLVEKSGLLAAPAETEATYAIEGRDETCPSCQATVGTSLAYVLDEHTSSIEDGPGSENPPTLCGSSEVAVHHVLAASPPAQSPAETEAGSRCANCDHTDDDHGARGSGVPGPRACRRDGPDCDCWGYIAPDPRAAPPAQGPAETEAGAGDAPTAQDVAALVANLDDVHANAEDDDARTILAAIVALRKLDRARLAATPPAPEGEAGSEVDWRARYSELIGKVDEWVAERCGDAAREDLIADLGVDGWLRVGWPPPVPAGPQAEGAGETAHDCSPAVAAELLRLARSYEKSRRDGNELVLPSTGLRRRAAELTSGAADEAASGGGS